MTSASAERPAVPPHVPNALCWDHNLDEYPEQFDDPFQACDAVHEGPDIIWAMRGAYRGRPGWVLTRFAHLQEAAMDNAQFTTSENRDAAGFLGFDLKLRPFEADPPDHTYYRQLLQPWFTPSAVRAREPMIVRVCGSLIDGFHSSGGCEFIGEFASLLPSNIFLNVMGLPVDMLRQFLQWENGFIRGPTVEARRSATRAIYDYFKNHLEHCRRHPKDDLVSNIATGEIGGRRLDQDEAIGTCMVLYIAGLDTVKSSLGWHMRHLASDQMLQSHLRRLPDLLTAAVDELLRAYGVACNGRTLVHDVEFHGVPMRAGDVVAMPSFFASRDPREYPDPHVVDINRHARHMSFGTGIHTCLGIHLAKQEIRIVLEQFLSRFKNIRIPEVGDVSWTSRGVWGITTLPLAWDEG